MVKIIQVSFLIWAFSQSLAADSSKPNRGTACGPTQIEFQGGAVYFKAIRSDSQLQYTDPVGSRTLGIKSCNKKIVNDFWNKLNNITENLQVITPIQDASNPTGAWLKVEKKKFPVLSFEPGLSSLNRIPNQSLILFFESDRLCKK